MRRIIPLPILLIALSSCEKYSPETVAALQASQAEWEGVYASLAGEINQPAIDSARNTLKGIHESQKARGKDNALMTGQVGDVLAVIDLHLNQRKEGGAWSEAAAGIYTGQIQRAFKTAIDTEESKRR